MKFIISENKINQIILNYLNDNIKPEPNYYGRIWGQDYHEQNRRDVRQFNHVTFSVNDEDAFTFYKEYSTAKNVLSISPWLSDNLTSLFNDKWLPIFKEWFERNSGLKVYHIDIW